MIGSGLSDAGVAPSAGSSEVGEGLQEAVPGGAASVADSADGETRHRLRRTLRILLAARRRDERGFSHGDG